MGETTDDEPSETDDSTDGRGTTGDESGDSGDATDTQETDDSKTATDPLTKAIETVTPPYVSRRDVEMDALAWGGVALLIVVLFPFLPILVAGWATLKLIELIADRT